MDDTTGTLATSTIGQDKRKLIHRELKSGLSATIRAEVDNIMSNFKKS